MWRLAFTLALLLAQPLGRASPTDPALAHSRELFEHAEALYTLTHYEEALVEYERAYEARPLPGFLFNIGQCHRQLQHWDKAAHFYRAYLDRMPTARNRSIVESLIVEMEAKQGQAPSAQPAAGPRPALPPGADLRSSSLTPAGGGTRTDPPTPLYRRWYLWAGIGGAVLVGAGIGLGAGLGGSGVDVAQGTLGTVDAR
jgi:hypothetical protein